MQSQNPVARLAENVDTEPVAALLLQAELNFGRSNVRFIRIKAIQQKTTKVPARAFARSAKNRAKPSI